MDERAFEFAGTHLTACASAVLWWPDQGLLCVSDLHLGKSQRVARRGAGLLPPYDTSETLQRLSDEIARLNPRIVVSLGDSFDDDACAAALPPETEAQLRDLMVGRDWIWIAGNHDPAPKRLGGAQHESLSIGPLTFRHIANSNDPAPEISGHYHPKLRLSARGRRISRSCFIYNTHRVILPAFGAYTGGLYADSQPLLDVIGREGRAILTGDTCVEVPLAPVLERL